MSSIIDPELRMNLRFDFVIKAGILTPVIGPVILFILSEIYETDTFFGTVIGLLFSYLPILFMGFLFSIPMTLVLYGFQYIVKKATNNVVLIRSFILMMGCLLIISTAVLLGYNFNENNDLIWPLAYCLTLFGLCIFVKDVRPLTPKKVRL